MEKGEKRWMKAGEAADYLSVHRVTIYRMLYAHGLPGVKLKGVGWRIDRPGNIGGSIGGAWRPGNPNLLYCAGRRRADNRLNCIDGQRTAFFSLLGNGG